MKPYPEHILLRNLRSRCGLRRPTARQTVWLSPHKRCGRDRGRLALHAEAVAPHHRRQRHGKKRRAPTHALDRKLHQTIAAMVTNIEALAFNKAVANIGVAGQRDREGDPPPRGATAAIGRCSRLVARIVPHVAEEALGGGRP